MFKTSVIIPMYRCANTFEATVNSIINQSQPPYEIIAILDGFDAEIIDRFAKANFPDFVKLIQLSKNLGVSNARNVGIRRATGSLIAFCDSDDIWHPQKLELQYELVERGFKLIGTQAERFSSSKVLKFEETNLKIRMKLDNINYGQLKLYNPFYMSSVLICRDTLGETEFNCSSQQEDYQFFVELFFSKRFPAVIDQRRLIGYRVAEGSRSGNIFFSFKNNFFLKMKNFGLFSAIFSIPTYICLVVIKRYFK